MVKIVITRQDGHVGFSMNHIGIYDDSGKVYEGAYGNVPGLRESLLDLLKIIEESEQTLIKELEAAVKNESLLPVARTWIEKELNKWKRGRR